MLVSSLTVITTVAGDQEVLGPNERRYSVLFLASSNQAGNIDIANLTMTAQGQGFGLQKPSTMFPLCVDYHGIIVQGPWHAYCSAANDHLTIIEAFNA